MHYAARRRGFHISGGWFALVIVIGALVATAFWIGPLRPIPPELHVVALGQNGEFSNSVVLPATHADTAHLTGIARIPLVLAVENTGTRPGSPTQLVLNLPSHVRLSTTRGSIYPPRVTPGNPLTRYVFDLNTGPIEPGEAPRTLPNPDTLWIEPVVPSFYCTAHDSIPEFVPAPPQNAELLANVQAFYAVRTGPSERQTGILHLRVDPSLLQQQPPQMPPLFPVTVMEPQVKVPDPGQVRYFGMRTTACGDPGRPMQLTSVLWQNPQGGRVYGLHFGSKVRKYLYDLNRDSIIELEIWDADADGKFESSRVARMPTPEYLIPRPDFVAIDSTMVADSMRRDSLRRDSIARDSLHRDSLMGGPRHRAEAVRERWRADSLNALRARRERARADSAAGRPHLAPLDSAAVRRAFTRSLFADTAAGPFRFYDALQRAREEGRSRPAMPRRTEEPLRLLGTPVPNAPPAPRRDTIRRDTLR